MPSNAWNQTAGATCAETTSTASGATALDPTQSPTVTGLIQGTNTTVTVSDPPPQFSTNMSSSSTSDSAQPNPGTSDLRTDTSGTWLTTSSTILSTDAQISTKSSGQLGASTENSILGFPGVSSATRRLTIPTFSSTVLTLTRTVTTLLTTTVPSSSRSQE